MSKATKPPASYLFVLPWQLGAAGGVNQVVENLMLQMQHNTHYRPVLLSCSWHCPPGFQGEIDTGASWYNLWLREPGGRWQSWRQNLSFFAHAGPAVWSLAKLFRKQRIRVVNIHYPVRGQLLIACAARLLRLPLIISFHGTELASAEQTTGIARWHWQLMFGWATEIVCCSNQLAKRFKGSFPGFVNKCAVIANGIDPQLLETKQAEGVSYHQTDNKVILTTGSFVWEKGQDVLLQAFAQLPETIRRNYDLVLLGRQGPALSQLQAWLEGSEIADRVFFYADVPHEDVLATMQQADLFVLPSRQEAFGIVLLEAGLGHLPIIASCVGGIPEVVVDGETGVLVEPENSAALAEAIVMLITDADSARSFADKMYNRAQCFTWAAAYSQYMALPALTPA